MSLPIVINPEAEADLAEAKSWYNRQVPGLGDDLISRVEAVFRSLQRSPKMCVRVFEETRLSLMPRFPYAIVYRIDDTQITILAVYHTSRDPRGWQQRK